MTTAHTRPSRWAAALLTVAAAALVVVVALSLGVLIPTAQAQPKAGCHLSQLDGYVITKTCTYRAKAKDNLGNFNHSKHRKAPVVPRTQLTPQGAAGACWPSNTFNYKGADAAAVTYLRGKDARDTHDTYKVVVSRDTAWLRAYQTYYHYTPGQSDASWHSGLVVVQLPYPISVENTYCPDGQQNVRQLGVQTLQKGEWVYFLRGHAPGDGTNIIPVRKANCGNFLLPPPAQPKATKPAPKPTRHAATTPPKVTPPRQTPPKRTTPPKTTPPPKVTPPKCTTGCHTAPPPSRCKGVRPTNPGNGWAYDSKTCTYHKVAQTKPCMLNGGPKCAPNGGHQPVQSNPGQPIGPTKGVAHDPQTGQAVAPTPNPAGPTPTAGTKAPDPNQNGYNSGSQDGSGTPGGSTCDSTGCTGGGSTPGSGPTDTTHSGDNNGVTDGTGGDNGTDDGGTSTGDGTIVNPFG